MHKNHTNAFSNSISFYLISHENWLIWGHKICEICALYWTFADCAIKCNPFQKLLKINWFLKCQIAQNIFKNKFWHPPKVPKLIEECLIKEPKLKINFFMHLFSSPYIYTQSWHSEIIFQAVFLRQNSLRICIFIIFLTIILFECPFLYIRY